MNVWDSVRFRTASTHWNLPWKYGPCGEPFFFSRRSRWWSWITCRPISLFSGNVQGVRADFHLLAAGADGPSGGQSPDLGHVEIWLSKSLDWDGDVESWTGSEDTFSSEECEHNVESLALNVIGEDQSCEKI